MHRFAVAGLALAAGWILPALAPAADIVLGRLVMRDYDVTIASSAEGLRYSIRARDGRELASRLAPQELLSRYPDIHSQVTSGVAAAPGEPGVIIWAGR